MTAPAHDWIHLEDVSFPCVLGLLPWEKHQEQRLALDLSLGLDLEPAAGGDLARSVDYAAVLDQVQFVAQKGRWRLLESLAAALARALLAPPAAAERRAAVDEVIVRLRKPDVLRGRGTPCIELRRARAWCALPLLATTAEGVRVEILQETRQTGAYRVHLAPGATWSPPAEVACLIVAGQVQADGFAAAPGATLERGAHRLLGADPLGSCLLAVAHAPLSAVA